LHVPKVSVVVPLYNKAPFIKRTLESIARQSLVDFEVIVVNDGSTDGGAEIARRFPDPRFRVVDQQNAGPGSARNRGVAHAAAPLVAFLDGDDCWRPEYLEVQAGIMDAHPEIACTSSGWVDMPKGAECAELWSRRGVTEGAHHASTETPANLFAVRVCYMHPCTTMMRTVAVKAVGGFREMGCRFAEDSFLFLKLALNHELYLHLRPLVELHRELAQLSGNYSGARAVEPYLSDPELIREACPSSLNALLDRFYAIRACKTACMLGYWGKWRESRKLISRFVSLRDWRSPLFLPALAASTPFGGLAGNLWRSRRGNLPASLPEPQKPATERAKAAAAGGGR
jgi:glycosyltransferase involved in cell wall biosynthesis